MLRRQRFEGINFNKLLKAFQKILTLCILPEFQGPLAQSVEQRTFNPWVVGSIPTGPTLLKR